jgi:hypothetical protein
MRRIASLSLSLLLVFSVLAGALPASAAASGTAVPDRSGQVYQTGADVPASVSGSVSPMSGPSGTTFTASVSGFWGHEPVGVWWNAPDGTIVRASDEDTRFVDWNGKLTGATWSTIGDMPGIWSMVVHGLGSGHDAVLYYEITSANEDVPAAADIPAPVSATISANAGPAGTLFKTTFSGFSPSEPVGYWFNTPEGVAQEAVNQGVNWASDKGVLDNFTGSSGMEPGLWSCVVQGIKSGHQAIVYFVISPSGTATISDPTFPTQNGPHFSSGNGRGHQLNT